jgi:hypothetical protein
MGNQGQAFKEAFSRPILVEWKQDLNGAPDA